MKEICFIAILSSSHWDREWFRDFRTFQFRLKKVMDEVLDTLESRPDFPVFITDGQTAMLEDYLEAAPDNAERVHKLLDSGRLITGPFYTLPDENLVTGESLIANLRLGHEITAAHTQQGPWKMGYLCDMFGHIPQMPQILNGFGIQNAILGRGTNQEETKSYFRWRSPDGSEVLAFKHPEYGGYGSFWFDLYSDEVQGEDSASEKTLSAAVRSAAREAERVHLPYLILMDGVDHEPLHHSLPAVADKLAAHFNCPAVIGGVDTVFSLLQQHRGTLPVIQGELQQPARANAGHHALITGTLCSRIDVKQQNDALSVLLEKNAAAASALSLLYNISAPDALLRHARRLWLQNHAHDSICGCAIGTVNSDMLSRCREAASIAENYIGNIYAGLCSGSTFKDSSEQKVVFFNFLPYGIHGMQQFDIFFPPNYSHVQTEQMPDEPINSFHLFDTTGEVPYQLLSVRKNSVCRRNGEAYPEMGDRYSVLANLRLPPMGSTTLVVKPSEKPVRYSGSMRTGPLRMENQALRVSVGNDGSVSLCDKLTGKTFDDLLHFRHEGETGDAWYHRKSIGGAETYAHFAGAQVTTDGPVACQIKIHYRMPVPKSLLYLRDEIRPASEIAENGIDVLLTLAKGERFLRMDIVVDNRSKDGKITLSLPSAAKEWFAETPFSFVKRQPGRNTDTDDWFETDKVGKSFSGVAYEKDGLAFISKGGLHECGINTDTHRWEIALLRSFRKNFLTDGEPDGQLLGEHRYSAWILPAGDFCNADFIRMRESLQTRVFYDTMASDGAVPEEKTSGVFVDAKQSAASLISKSRKGLLLRLVNYGNTEDTAAIHFPLPIQDAWITDLMERPHEKIPHDGATLRISLSPHKIVTILLALRQAESPGPRP